MSQLATVDVAIVGGGPVGMVLACELIRHGLTVRIFDKGAATKKNSRAPIFWPRAQDALDLLGLHHLWNGTTTPMRRMNVNVYGKPAGRVELGDGQSAHPVAMLVGQDVSEAILDRHLSEIGAPVERSMEAIDITMHGDGGSVTLRRADGITEVVHAQWIIGCDGSDSFVRRSVRIGWEGGPLKGLMVPLADAKATWTLPNGDGEAYVALTKRGYLLAIPLPGLWRVIVATPDTTAPGEHPITTLDEVAQLTSDAIGGPVDLRDASWVSVVRYGNYIAPDFRKDRAFLAGDAAHSIAPLSGQGMNTGVQDAFNLGWKIAYVHKGWSNDDLLDSYSAERRPVAARLVKTTSRFFHRVLKPSASQQRLARIAAPIALSFGRVREKIAGFYTETDVSYRESPLNDKYRARLVAPGDHVRDGNLISWPHRQPLRLYDAIRGTAWTAILFCGEGAKQCVIEENAARLNSIVLRFGRERLKGLIIIGSPSTSLNPSASVSTIAIDAWLQVHDTYNSRRGSLVLIRPDGYVALHRSTGRRGFHRLEHLLLRILSPIGELNSVSERKRIFS